ncbi:MAPEG family protein [Terricaulis silvestris]|uniref:MAPEG family protein n=1 Tax=Terricaulis silvestris TaxID=2686094 RepID=A0A6I6MP39_9CAUL|nr:MAPEG family protein [Terricaulis silvestris]QGZ94547.1 MAPEG family protein [Terricaulis silvestris]
MYEHGMITPVVALIAWSLLMLLWLYATRIPAMSKAKVKPGEATKAQMEALSSANVANNYNHLMEQPTLFYALCFALQLLGQGDHPINIGLAWTYVVIRIIHSLVQATVNVILIRFSIFMLGTLVLIALCVHAMIAVGMIQWDFTH